MPRPFSSTRGPDVDAGPGAGPSYTPARDAIQETRDPQLLRAVRRLRVAAWRDIGAGPESLPDDEWWEVEDDTARHWVALHEGSVVAAARMTLHHALGDVPDAAFYAAAGLRASPPIASINRLVIAPSHRRAGLSRLLDEARVAAARASGCGVVVGYVYDLSGAHRFAALLRQGFVQIGGRGAVAGRFGPATVVALYP